MLWRSLSQLLGRDRDVAGNTDYTADSFAEFFDKKAQVKSCTLDPVPTFLVREFVDLLLPFLTTLVNTSLMQGQLPA